jgi:hypothetical protein
MSNPENNQVAILDPQRLVGKVQQVGQSDTQILITNQDFSSDEFKNFSIGDYLIIANNSQALYVKVSDLVSADSDAIAVAQYILTIEVVEGEIELTPGVQKYPSTGANVYVADPRFVKYISESSLGTGSNLHNISLAIGSLKNNGSSLSITPEKLFGRHCAVLGTSGSGKSWTVAKLIEQSAQFNSKIILFDATGEYYTLGSGVRHVYIGDDPNPRSGSIQVAIPYQQLKTVDLSAIFKPNALSQASKLSYAIKTLKLLKYVPNLGYGGVFVKAHKEKLAYEAQYRKYYNKVENPYCDFDIMKLCQQIENECVFPNRSITEPNFWGAPNTTELGECTGLVNRIADIISSPNLACVFDAESIPSLIDEIDYFLKDPASKVLRISLQYLPFAYGVREILANSLARRMLEMARLSHFKKNPLVLILDEAHQFLNETVVNPNSEFPLDAFSLIAKEGRKYGLTLGIATQRPRDIPEGVLSQIGTLFVHRLINDLDRKVIERASGEMQKEVLAVLPTLTPGETILMGVDFAIPLNVLMSPPSNRPDSTGPNYQMFWS